MLSILDEQETIYFVSFRVFEEVSGDLEYNFFAMNAEISGPEDLNYIEQIGELEHRIEEEINVKEDTVTITNYKVLRRLVGYV